MSPKKTPNPPSPLFGAHRVQELPKGLSTYIVVTSPSAILLRADGETTINGHMVLNTTKRGSIGEFLSTAGTWDIVHIFGATKLGTLTLGTWYLQ